jgi:hypothetical protein
MTPGARQLILHAYFKKDASNQQVSDVIQDLDLEGASLDAPGYPTPLDAAVAAVLLRRGWRSAVEPPIHLFTINWADSGFAQWPTQYRVSRIGEARRAVVTASGDREAYGFADFAIGHFALPNDLKTSAGRIIVRHWRQRAADGQMRWEEFWEAGAVNLSQASAWADRVKWYEPE